MLKNKIHLIAVLSLITKLFVVFLFHEDSLKDEWFILFKNFENFNSYSFYIFDGMPVPSSYMPPLYFSFLYLNKILSLDLINFIYLVVLNQVILSTISVYIFFSICKNFFDFRVSIIGTFLFSIFPIILFANGLVSSAIVQLFLYLFFIKIFLDFTVKPNKFNLIALVILSSLNLLLRGEFLIIFLFSLVFLIILNKKRLIKAVLLLVFTLILISPYLIRNYNNTGKIHLVNSSGYALWKGNNQVASVEGFHNPLHPENRSSWPEIIEFKNLYQKLDNIPKDQKYEINRDRVFQDEALENISLDKKRYVFLYFKKFFSYFFIDLNSSIKNYYNLFHIVPILLISICSIPGVFIGLKKNKDPKIIYLFLMTCLLIGLMSLFFILPRYKISIICSQIIFSLFFFEYLLKKIRSKL